MAACELLKTVIIFTPFLWSISLFSIVSSSASPIAHSSASMISIRPVHRLLRRDLHSSLCLHTAMAPTRPSSERDPSVHHIQTPAPTLASFSLAHHCAALLAAEASSSMTVLTTDSSPSGGQLMPSVVRPCSWSFFTALHSGAPEEGFWCSFLSLLLHVFASLATKCCCLDSKIMHVGVSPESLIKAPRGVVDSAPRIDLACRLRRSWRLSRLPASLGSHHSSLPYSATAWTHATWSAHTLSGMTPYVFVTIRNLASAALAFFMHWLWCSLSVRCTSIQTPSQHVAGLFNRMKPSTTLNFAVSFGRRFFLWPRLRVNSAASVFAVLNLLYGGVRSSSRVCAGVCEGVYCIV